MRTCFESWKRLGASPKSVDTRTDWEPYPLWHLCLHTPAFPQSSAHRTGSGGRIGGGQFADRSAAILTPTPKGPLGGGASAVDYDNDGDQDLFVPQGAFFSARARPNLLLRNDDGVYRLEEASGLTDVLPTDNAIWLDFDRNGWPDLYTGNLACDPPAEGVRNQLYKNESGRFVNVTSEAGLGVSFETDTNCLGGSNGGCCL